MLENNNEIGHELSWYTDIFTQAVVDSISFKEATEKCRKIEEELLRCGSVVAINCVSTARAKDILTQNTVSFPDDRSTQAEYFRYRGADLEISSMNLEIKKNIAIEITEFKSSQHVQEFFLKFVGNYKFNEKTVLKHWGKCSMALIEQIRTNILWAINPEFKTLLQTHR